VVTKNDADSRLMACEKGKSDETEN